MGGKEKIEVGNISRVMWNGYEKEKEHFYLFLQYFLFVRWLKLGWKKQNVHGDWEKWLGFLVW